MEKGKKTPKKRLRYRYLIRDVTILFMLAIMSIMVPMSVTFLVMYLTKYMAGFIMHESYLQNYL